MRGFYDTMTVRRLTSDDVGLLSVEDDGSWTIAQVITTVKGSFHHTLMYDRNPENMGQYGQRLVAIARLPLDVEISHGDQIVIENKHPSVNGTYEVSAVMLTPTHQRCETRRITTP